MAGDEHYSQLNDIIYQHIALNNDYYTNIRLKVQVRDLGN